MKPNSIEKYFANNKTLKIAFQNLMFHERQYIVFHGHFTVIHTMKKT